jgi:SAM-dependent methyltransferase
MKRFHFIRCFAIVLCLLLAAAGVFAQADPCADFTPYSGQPGKDVVWVPTPQELVDAMLDMAKVTASDYIIDLGSGDGRTVITAAKRGATALGIEYNPQMVEFAKCNAAKEKVTAKATFVEADIFKSDFSKATVITMFLLQSINRELRPIILDMKPGTRIVSNTFDMADWKADQTTTVPEGKCSGYYCTAYFWIVPAKVNGTWKLDNGQIRINQEFQNITGTLTISGKDQAFTGKLEGNKISFNAAGTEYTGTVNGNTISGTRAGGGSWKATR